ncbi:hypothetical protein [Eubacterium barkeri]|uniref:Uncharacterized protein n=1 Tax=Eubacterium barkeri TaxID=1528 RepID=A0A1H3HHF0_EUBBA|nr:hypothetical protein [Eubacterium barkeri]SDY14099.1 hypothetical protein SAMN04488579_11774 [Eubacterium barkeri]
METVSIDRESGNRTPCEFDCDAAGIGRIFCMILTGLTPEEMAREIVRADVPECGLEVAK